MDFNIFKLIVILFFGIISLSFITKSTIISDNCSVLKKGTFRYLDSDNKNDYFVIDGKNHIEYLNDGKSWIKSKVKWIEDCEYELRLNKINYPNFPFKKGDKLNIKILGGNSDTIFYKSQIGAFINKGRLLKIQ